MKLRLDILGATYEDACRIADRKSAWLVLWLRARRDGDTLRGYYRHRHFAERNAMKHNRPEPTGLARWWRR